MNQSSSALCLRPISAIESGEQIEAVALPPDRHFLIGRSSEADWPIPHPTLSRRHASIVLKGGTWLISDLKSRHGTTVNDRKVEPGKPIPIHDGDVVSFGSWRCRCTAGSIPRGETTPFAPAMGDAASVSAIPAQQLGGVAQRGLEVLMNLTSELDTAGTREATALAAVEAVREATRCKRVVVVAIESDTDLAVLASSSEQTPQVSRSLLEQATRQGLVQLTVTGGQGNQAQSILDLGIRSAICAPILVDGSPAAFLTIDTRDAEGVVPGDAASFCQSVARLVGLAFQRLSDATMAERHRQLQSDLDAARRAQELLSPPVQGRFGAVSYRFVSIPGRVVAGDLFDVFPLDDSRTAFFLGDVSGKGVGAAMLMAACQSQLRTKLLSGVELPIAMASVNTDLHQRTETSKFVTMMCGVLDAKRHSVQLVDAGHGLCIRARANGVTERIETTPGFPIGVVDTAEYDFAEFDFPPRDSLVLFSDGAVEQPNLTGVQYGIEGVLGSLAGVESPDKIVDALIGGVQNHASAPLADDLTVAAIWIE